MIRIIWTICVCLMSCSKKEVSDKRKTVAESLLLKEQAKNTEIKKEIVSKVDVHDTLDTFTTNNRSIIFFFLSQEEFDSIMDTVKSDIGREINDSIADFHSYIYVLKKELEGTGIKVEETSSRYYKIKAKSGDIVFDREKNNKMFGLIFSDGQKAPVIKEGVILLKEDYKKLIEEYFNIELSQN